MSSALLDSITKSWFMTVFLFLFCRFLSDSVFGSCRKTLGITEVDFYGMSFFLSLTTVLTSESQHKGSNFISLGSPVEQRMGLSHCSGSMF